MDVALGGTFDPIHDGHRALFDRAFELGDVVVGLTTDEFAPETRSEQRHVRPYEEREAALREELSRFADEYDREFSISPLSSPTGIAAEEPALEHLVVSPETRPVAERINDLRRERDLGPLSVAVVDHVPAEDGEPISSTRIVRGEIDEHGRRTPERGGREPREGAAEE